MLFQFATSQNMTQLTTMFGYVNTVTNGWFWIWALLSMWLVMLLSVTTLYGIQRGLVVTGFISVIMAGLMRTAGLISDLIVFLVVMAFFLSVMWAWWKPE